MHQVRVRELLPTDDGWLVAAPYEYTGTKAADTKYDAKNVAGDYEFVIHDQRTSFKGPEEGHRQASTDYRGVNKPVNITLTEDGKVTGDKTGTWKLDKSDGTGDMTITLDGVEYHGAFDRLPRDKDDRKGRDDVLRHRRQPLRLGLAEVVLSHCRPSLAPRPRPSL